MGGNSVSCLHCMYGHLLHLCFVFDLFFNRSVSNHCSSNQSFFLFIKQTFHNNYEGCGIKFKTCVVFSCLFTDHSLHVRCSCSMYLPYVAIYCPQRCLIPPPLQKKTLTFFSTQKMQLKHFMCIVSRLLISVTCITNEMENKHCQNSSKILSKNC